MTNLKLRLGVMAVFRNPESNLFLICERSDATGAWQFPQGGMEKDESPQVALYREMGEELGCDRFKILAESAEYISYVFPQSLKTNIARRYCGQEQKWFLVEFEKGFRPDLSKGDGEFQNWKWDKAENILSNIVDWKKDSYIQGFKALGIPSYK